MASNQPLYTWNWIETRLQHSNQNVPWSEIEWMCNPQSDVAAPIQGFPPASGISRGLKGISSVCIMLSWHGDIWPGHSPRWLLSRIPKNHMNHDVDLYFIIYHWPYHSWSLCISYFQYQGCLFMHIMLSRHGDVLLRPSCLADLQIPQNDMDIPYMIWNINVIWEAPCKMSAGEVNFSMMMKCSVFNARLSS